jgi:hypothetical protein
MQKKLENLAFRTLNTTSRLVLLKEKLQSMPLYLFFSLVTPKFILKEIRNLQKNFMWGGARNETKWALVA